MWVLENLHFVLLRFGTLVKLVIMESKHQNSDYCELFLALINKMMQSFASEKGNPVKPFSPTILQCDEHTVIIEG